MKTLLAAVVYAFYFIRLFLFVKNKENLKVKKLNNLWHRLFFLTIDVIGFSFLNFQLAGFVRYDLPLWSSWLNWAGATLFMAGLFFSAWSRFHLGANWDTAGTGGIKNNHQLITTGPFRISRNPIYLGTFSLFLGFEMALGSFFIFLAIPLFLLIIWEAKREEKLLENFFGEEFRRYKKHSPFFFPWFTA